MNRIIALAAAGVTTLAMAAHCQPDAAPADTTIRVNGNIEVAVAGSDSTITIYEGQVTITIQTSCMSCTQRNQVTVIDIVDGGCGITEYRSSVSIDSGRT